MHSFIKCESWVSDECYSYPARHAWYKNRLCRLHRQGVKYATLILYLFNLDLVAKKECRLISLWLRNGQRGWWAPSYWWARRFILWDTLQGEIEDTKNVRFETYLFKYFSKPSYEMSLIRCYPRFISVRNYNMGGGNGNKVVFPVLAWLW